MTIRAVVQVDSIEVVSRPQSQDTYKFGETIGIDVTSTEPVVVTGIPSLAIDLGSTRRAVPMVDQPGGAVQRFSYAVRAEDRDTDGFSIPANGLALGDASVVSTRGINALITHDAQEAGSSHKVNGSQNVLVGGIRDRAPQVIKELVRLAKANDNAIVD